MTAPGVLPPTVEATSDRTSGPARLTVQFTATGTDPDGPDSSLYAWDFGDGGKSFDQNPTHTYGDGARSRPRSRSATPAVRRRRKTMTITVADPAGNAAPFVESTGAFTDGLVATFSAEGSDADGDMITYAWDFDDGTAHGAGAEVKHTYARRRHVPGQGHADRRQGRHGHGDGADHDLAGGQWRADGADRRRSAHGHLAAGGAVQRPGDRSRRTVSSATCGRSATAASPPRRTRSTPTTRPARTRRR